jgi:hypothetical protein
MEDTKTLSEKMHSHTVRAVDDKGLCAVKRDM